MLALGILRILQTKKVLITKKINRSQYKDEIEHNGGTSRAKLSFNANKLWCI